jgi:hypothetical protein
MASGLKDGLKWCGMTSAAKKTGTKQYLSCKLEAQRDQDFRLLVELPFTEKHFFVFGTSN